MVARVAIGCALLLAVIACSSEPDVSDGINWQGPTMGTQWHITIGARSESIVTNASAALRQQVETELTRINGLMSTWDPDSELSRFNKLRSTDPIILHADTLTVLEQALRVAEATDGAYDVTRGAVFDLWGFGADDAPQVAPSTHALSDALSRGGWRSIRIDDSAVSKALADLTIDLSSLAKGFAVDQLGELLEDNGVEHYVVNIGGEIRARGERSENTAWRIGIERPDTTVETGLVLRDASLATSGSYRNVRLIDGERVPHLIDGRTGMPVSHNLVAVTVLHDTTLQADAWATAFMVIGGDATQHMLKENELAVQLTYLDEPDDSSVPDRASFSVWHSALWKRYTTLSEN